MGDSIPHGYNRIEYTAYLHQSLVQSLSFANRNSSGENSSIKKTPKQSTQI